MRRKLLGDLCEADVDLRQRLVVNADEYGLFGETRSAVEQVAQPFRYTGREYDAESGLYYYRARYYDPRLGRFISEDPIGLAGGVNPYAYVDNDPLNATDPSGLCQKLQYEQYHAEGDWAASGSHFHSHWACSNIATWGEGFSLGFLSNRRGWGPSQIPTMSAWEPYAVPTMSAARPVLKPDRDAAACVAASADLAFAVTGDLLSLTGAGMVATRGTRLASLGTKAMRTAQYLIQNRLTGALMPGNSPYAMRAASRWSSQLLVGAMWTTTNNVAQGESFNVGEELLSLIPLVNSGMKIRKYYQRCIAQ